MNWVAIQTNNSETILKIYVRAIQANYLTAIQESNWAAIQINNLEAELKSYLQPYK